MTIHSFSGCESFFLMLKGFIPCFGVEGAEKLLPLQHCRDALIAALAGQIGLACLQTIGKCRICQKCPCRTAEIRRDPAPESVPPFPHHESDCKAITGTERYFFKAPANGAYPPPWKHDRKFARPEIHASRLLPSHHQSSLHPLPFAETQCIRQLIAALYHLRRRNLYQYRGNLLLPHALPPEPPTGRSCRFLSDSHIHPFSDLSTERKILRKQIPCRCAHLYDYAHRFPCTMPPHWHGTSVLANSSAVISCGSALKMAKPQQKGASKAFRHGFFALFVSSAVEQLHNQHCNRARGARSASVRRLSFYRFRVAHIPLSSPASFTQAAPSLPPRRLFCPLPHRGVVASVSALPVAKPVCMAKHNPTIFQFQLSQPEWRKNHVNPSVSPQLLLLASYLPAFFPEKYPTEIFFQKSLSFYCSVFYLMIE